MVLMTISEDMWWRNISPFYGKETKIKIIVQSQVGTASWVLIRNSTFRFSQTDDLASTPPVTPCTPPVEILYKGVSLIRTQGCSRRESTPSLCEGVYCNV